MTRAQCIDLFCGAGGLTHGLLSEGVPVVAGLDIDTTCRYPFETNNPGALFLERDISRVKGEELVDYFDDAQYRILAGCAPCQPFSTYSQRYKGTSDNRWKLLKSFARIVGTIEPHIVTMENVPALENHKVFRDFCQQLECNGYQTWTKVVDCSQYGLPQRRRRLVMLASRVGYIALPDSDEAFRTTVRDAIGKMPRLEAGESLPKDRLHATSRLSPTNLRRIRASKPGGTWRDWPKRLVAECHRRETGNTYPGVYGRMVWDEPAPTLTTQFYGFGNGRFGHPEQDRALSLREGAILQGFPPDYDFLADEEPIRFKLLGRLIGNAVPVKLGQVLGKAIREHLGICDPK